MMYKKKIHEKIANFQYEQMCMTRFVDNIILSINLGWMVPRLKIDQSWMVHATIDV